MSASQKPSRFSSVKPATKKGKPTDVARKKNVQHQQPTSGLNHETPASEPTSARLVRDFLYEPPKSPNSRTGLQHRKAFWWIEEDDQMPIQFPIVTEKDDERGLEPVASSISGSSISTGDSDKLDVVEEITEEAPFKSMYTSVIANNNRQLASENDQIKQEELLAAASNDILYRWRLRRRLELYSAATRDVINSPTERPVLHTVEPKAAQSVDKEAQVSFGVDIAVQAQVQREDDRVSPSDNPLAGQAPSASRTSFSTTVRESPEKIDSTDNINVESAYEKHVLDCVTRRLFAAEKQTPTRDRKVKICTKSPSQQKLPEQSCVNSKLTPVDSNDALLACMLTRRTLLLAAIDRIDQILFS